MNIIYKYELGITEHQKIETFYNHRRVKATNQDGKLCLWTKVDDASTPLVDKIIWYVFTQRLMPHSKE